MSGQELLVQGTLGALDRGRILLPQDPTILQQLVG